MTENLFVFIYQNRDGSGKHYIVDLSNESHVNWLHQLLRICPIKNQSSKMEGEIAALKDRIVVLEQPLRIAKLKQVLVSEPQGRTEVWIRNRIPHLPYYELNDLAEKGIVESFLKNKVRMYRLKKEAIGK